jgi:hypothetical protein
MTAVWAKAVVNGVVFNETFADNVAAWRRNKRQSIDA